MTTKGIPKLSAESMMWAESTVRWLKERHPEYYCLGGATKTWPEKLVAALSRMSWREVELVKKGGLFKEAYIAKIREAVSTWNKERHDEVVEFLRLGGYEAEEAKLPGEVFTVSEDESESIALEPDEMNEAVLGLSPKAEMSPDHELEEIVAVAAKQADARYGAW